LLAEKCQLDWGNSNSNSSEIERMRQLVERAVEVLEKAVCSSTQ